MVTINSSVLDDFLKEIESGRVETLDAIYNIKIYVNTIKNNDYDSLVPILRIRNKSRFKHLLEEYLTKLLEGNNNIL